MVKHGKVSLSDKNHDEEMLRQIVSDEMVPASTNNSTISNIYAKLQGSSYLLQFCDAEGNVFLLSDGEIVKLGTVINGRFKKDKDAQADRWPDEIQSNIKWKGMK